MIKTLEEVLTGKSTVAVSGHVKPDGDCVGSTLGVYNYLRTYHPDITAVLYLEDIPPAFSFLCCSGEIVTEVQEHAPFDLFICLDCGDLKRLGDRARYFEEAKDTLCIDHHISNHSFARENYIFPEASSTCELVYQLIPKEHITKEIAECLYTGMVHDTGVFQYSCTHRSTMEAAGFLMECGINFPVIVNETFYQKTYAETKAMGLALMKSRLHLEGKVISSMLSQEDFVSIGSCRKDTEGIVSQLRCTKGVEASILMYQTGEGEYKLSLRSSSIVDCAAITMKYGGGGHVRAAGATLQGDPETFLKEILTEMKMQLEAGA